MVKSVNKTVLFTTILPPALSPALTMIMLRTPAEFRTEVKIDVYAFAEQLLSSGLAS
jgi:hypothetical protein